MKKETRSHQSKENGVENGAQASYGMGSIAARFRGIIMANNGVIEGVSNHPIVCFGGRRASRRGNRRKWHQIHALYRRTRCWRTHAGSASSRQRRAAWQQRRQRRGDGGRRGVGRGRQRTVANNGGGRAMALGVMGAASILNDYCYYLHTGTRRASRSFLPTKAVSNTEK